MSDKRPHEGLDVNDLPTDEWKNQKPHQTNDKESDVNETGVIPQNFVVGLARKVSTEEEDVTHRGQQLSKRAVFSEEVQNRDQAEQNKQAAKKPRSDTESHLHKPHPKLKPNEPLILKSKETKLVTALEENLVSTEKESSFHKTNDTALTDLNYQSHHSKVTDETEGLYSPAKTDSAKSRQEGELVKVLLKFPNLFHEDDDGDTLLHMAIVHNEYSLAQAIIYAMVKRKDEHPYSGLDIQNNLRQAAMHLAVLTCQPRIVRNLAENGADANSPDRNGQTALHLACKNADLEDVRALREGVGNWQRESGTRERSIDVNARNYEGVAPVHLATLSGSCEVLGELLEMGADIDLKDSSSGRTALHHAVEAHNPIVARFLLTHNANVNAQTFAGNTPLHTASGRRMEAIISLLISFGADPRLANVEGDPPLLETHRLYSYARRSTESAQEKTKR